ncbi:clp amino terminal domain protein, partial [Vibrio parahaemolyticus V-223/04]|jgi:hypothetical protein
VTKS